MMILLWIILGSFSDAACEDLFDPLGTGIPDFQSRERSIFDPKASNMPGF